MWFSKLAERFIEPCFYDLKLKVFIWEGLRIEGEIDRLWEEFVAIWKDFCLEINGWKEHWGK
jgi:hypothetical protein